VEHHVTDKYASGIFVEKPHRKNPLGSEEFYNIIIKFGMADKLLRLIKMYIDEISNRICVGKHFSYAIPIHNELKKVIVKM
jgi:hypothetical protein